MPSRDAKTPYVPDAPFEQAEISGAIPHREVLADGKQLWLMQLPDNVDLKELTGGKLKFTEDADGDTATLKAPSGASFKMFCEHPMLASQLYMAAPKGTSKLSDVRKVDRRVTLVGASIGGESTAPPPASETAAADAAGKKGKRDKQKKRKSADGDAETPRKEKKSKKDKDKGDADDTPRKAKKHKEKK